MLLYMILCIDNHYMLHHLMHLNSQLHNGRGFFFPCWYFRILLRRDVFYQMWVFGFSDSFDMKIYYPCHFYWCSVKTMQKRVNQSLAVPDKTGMGNSSRRKVPPLLNQGDWFTLPQLFIQCGLYWVWTFLLDVWNFGWDGAFISRTQ